MNWQQTIASLPSSLQREVELALTHLLEACDVIQRETYAALLNDLNFSQRLAKLFACSQFAAQLCRRHPDWLITSQQNGELDHNFTHENFAARLQTLLQHDGSGDALDSALRRFRNREYLRIIWRDLNRLAEMAETTADISAVAETTIQTALDFHYAQLQREWGAPCSARDGSAQPFIVIGMGKLGARELNLSSDVDLIFAYPRSGETKRECSGETHGTGKSISNQEFFIQLGQRLIKSLEQNTADGFVFRVDMRLRPYGDSGALVLNFDALEEYYQDQGRDWERYAMIKARPVAESTGSTATSMNFPAGNRLIEILRPFTYRRYLDYSAFEALREMKMLIHRDVQRRRLHDNIKLGAGGIREIEFIAQCFQLIRGGRERRLQERNLQRVLVTLAELNYLPAAAVGQLQQAYIFLRNTEHAIQAWLDQQSQALPKADLPRSALAYALGYHNWPSFQLELDRHRQHVSAHFNNIIALPMDKQEANAAHAYDRWQTFWMDEELSLDNMAQQLAAAGFDQVEEAARRCLEMRTSKAVQLLQTTARARLDTFMPQLLQALTQVERPGTTLLRILPLVEAVLRRTAYLVLLVENPAALRELVLLCAASPWISRQLTQHPVLLDELLNAGTLYTAPEKTALQRDLREQLLRLEWNDLEGQMDALRYFKLAHSLRVAASEISGTLPLMKVSDYLTWIAETIIDHVLELAWHHLTDKYGTPRKADGALCAKDFIVVGYGKLGGIELSHGSDLDLVFIHAADPSLTTDGAIEIDNSTFFTRLGQRMIHILSTQTALGPLYEVDMRLRPSGNSGLLVSSLKAFADYQLQRAWTWEHQALVRARVIAGDRGLADAFNQVRREILCQPRDLDKLRNDVLAMRQKMREQLRPRNTETAEHPVFDLKHGSAAMIDIEFIAQYAVLAWAHTHPELARWTDNIRILETLQQNGLCSEQIANGLIEAYKAYRSAAHRLNLQQQPGLVALNDFARERESVIAAWQTFMAEKAGRKKH
ncbi:MAG TPA: bifunctional [glutamate--ammonia ligase]-adenylyl-L-tyrosine phosphorylase/[glutamate--ammonia-ligase] adenylyltransferase [Spongiibacteraceae bacterium]